MTQTNFRYLKISAFYLVLYFTYFILSVPIGYFLLILGLVAGGGLFSGGNIFSTLVFLLAPSLSYLILFFSVWRLIFHAKKLNVENKTRNIAIALFLIAFIILDIHPIKRIFEVFWSPILPKL